MAPLNVSVRHPWGSDGFVIFCERTSLAHAMNHLVISVPAQLAGARARLSCSGIGVTLAGGWLDVPARRAVA
ncbi:MAG TPA: hypothetical protein VJ843_00335 [Candidatus Saccharimonadales bacterium]|nr:hypothetical protein [Candidatus Saccharimonadales bacterium]